MQDFLSWYISTFVSAGWNLGAWLDQMRQVWAGIGGWTGLIGRIGLFLMAWTVLWVFILWWDKKSFSEPEDAVEQTPADGPVEEQPTMPLELAQISIPMTPLKARKGQFAVDGVIAAAENELSLLWEKKRGER